MYEGVSFGLVSKRAPLVDSSSENKISYAASCELWDRKLDASFDPEKHAQPMFFSKVENDHSCFQISLFSSSSTV